MEKQNQEMWGQDPQRVELRLHTAMSDAGSLITPKGLVQEASFRGIRAIAVTDQNSVQNFPELARCREMYGKDLKVIYGAELVLPLGEFATVLVKDQAGLKPLYKLLSGKTITPQERSHLLIGAHHLPLLSRLARAADVEEFSRLVQDYDYIELCPFQYDPGFLRMNRKLYRLGKQQSKPIVAVGDCRYLFPHHKLAMDVLCYAKHKILRSEEEHLRTTEEMLARYDYLGQEAAQEVVITNPAKIAADIQQVDPRKGAFPEFRLPDAEREVKHLCRERLQELYGEEPLAHRRLKDELAQVKDMAFSMYLLCHKLTRHLQAAGGWTGHRGTIGSTFIAYLLGISDVNPLPAHHRCPACRHTEFVRAGSGFDLPRKRCPQCGAIMEGDGQDIPFETCLGVDRDMDLDIDLNMAPELRQQALKFLGQLLGEDRIAAGGVIHTYRHPSAKALVQVFMDGTNQELSREEQDWLVQLITQVKRQDATHPGGIMLLPEGMEWEDVTPLYPNGDDACSAATHLECFQIDPAVPKLDVLCVRWYAQLQELCALTGVRPEAVDYQDPEVYRLFREGETAGIPEFDQRFTRNLLRQVQASCFSDLLKASGMAHGTEVWNHNGEELVWEHNFSELLSHRDDVFQTLRRHGFDRKTAYGIMCAARKGRLPWKGKVSISGPAEERYLRLLKESDVPEWYVASMQKVLYLFPKAHSAHYTKLAVAFAWFKVHHPAAFYRVMLPLDILEPFAGCTDRELQALLSSLESREWAAVQLLLEARAKGFADPELCPG